jgi:predicted site-specific integrase-resolvase
MASIVATSCPEPRTGGLPELLRPEEVAAALQVTPRTVRRWGATGQLERVRLGSRLTRYTAASVAALIGSTDGAP